MNTSHTLQQQAINAAKSQDWSAAVAINTQLLEINESDVGALNRLGVAQLQLGQASKAKASFQKVIQLDRSNTIAKKHLDRLKSNQTPASPSFSQVYFIEEPGKTKIVELHRLAGKQVLDVLAVGQSCELKPKNRYISVESNQTYIGALPEDLSFRLTKLLKNGNEYQSFVYSTSNHSCIIYIREVVRSVANQDVHSFPLVKSNLATINDLDQDFLFEDNIPVQMLDSDMGEDDKSFEVGDRETETEA